METTKETTKAKKGKYIEAVGRRKTSVARVRITEGSKMHYEVNGKSLDVYFPTRELQETVKDPFTTLEGLSTKFGVTIVVKGGGINSQAEAVRHGLSRTLVEFQAESRKGLKEAGFLKRDPRSKERRKFGLKKARKSPQWSKR